jgi:hypothetical protein
MVIVFYLIGGVMAAVGLAWAGVAGVGSLTTGNFVGIIAVLIAAAYVFLAGALFVAVAAILSRLDRLISNTSDWDRDGFAARRDPRDMEQAYSKRRRGG